MHGFPHRKIEIPKSTDSAPASACGQRPENSGGKLPRAKKNHESPPPPPQTGHSISASTKYPLPREPRPPRRCAGALFLGPPPTLWSHEPPLNVSLLAQTPTGPAVRTRHGREVAPAPGMGGGGKASEKGSAPGDFREHRPLLAHPGARPGRLARCISARPHSAAGHSVAGGRGALQAPQKKFRRSQEIRHQSLAEDTLLVHPQNIPFPGSPGHQTGVPGHFFYGAASTESQYGKPVRKASAESASGDSARILRRGPPDPNW